MSGDTVTMRQQTQLIVSKTALLLSSKMIRLITHFFVVTSVAQKHWYRHNVIFSIASYSAPHPKYTYYPDIRIIQTTCGDLWLLALTPWQKLTCILSVELSITRERVGNFTTSFAKLGPRKQLNCDYGVWVDKNKCSLAAQRDTRDMECASLLAFSNVLISADLIDHVSVFIKHTEIYSLAASISCFIDWILSFVYMFRDLLVGANTFYSRFKKNSPF